MKGALINHVIERIELTKRKSGSLLHATQCRKVAKGVESASIR